MVVVARTTLGTINHALLTIEALRARSIWVGGILFSGNAMPDSEATICAMGKVRSLGQIPALDPLTPETLRAAAETLDLADLA